MASKVCGTRSRRCGLCFIYSEFIQCQSLNCFSSQTTTANVCSTTCTAASAVSRSPGLSSTTHPNLRTIKNSTSAAKEWRNTSECAILFDDCQQSGIARDAGSETETAKIYENRHEGDDGITRTSGRSWAHAWYDSWTDGIGARHGLRLATGTFVQPIYDNRPDWIQETIKRIRWERARAWQKLKDVLQ